MWGVQQTPPPYTHIAYVYILINAHTHTRMVPKSFWPNQENVPDKILVFGQILGNGSSCKLIGNCVCVIFYLFIFFLNCSNYLHCGFTFLTIIQKMYRFQYRFLVQFYLMFSLYCPWIRQRPKIKIHISITDYYFCMKFKTFTFKYCLSLYN